MNNTTAAKDVETFFTVTRTIEVFVEESYSVLGALPDNWDQMDDDDRFDWVQEHHEERHDRIEEVQGTMQVHSVVVTGWVGQVTQRDLTE